MSQDEIDEGPPRPGAPKPSPEAPAPGNLWSEFLRRNLLLAGLAGTAALQTAQEEAERPAEK